MKDNQGRNESGLSRRDFLRGSGAASVVSALTTTALPVVSEADEKVAETNGVAYGPAPVKLTLNVNGQKMTTDVEPRVTLLDALRNYLDVTGCKKVCDRASCGACTVMLDGQPVYSCTTLALEAKGKELKTAEALVDGDKLDEIPTKFVEYDAQQCGFCTPGFVVAMRAAFNKNPDATPEEIEEAISGNICRCGTYEQMRQAIESLCKKGG